MVRSGGMRPSFDCAAILMRRRGYHKLVWECGECGEAAGASPRGLGGRHERMFVDRIIEDEK